MPSEAVSALPRQEHSSRKAQSRDPHGRENQVAVQILTPNIGDSRVAPLSRSLNSSASDNVLDARIENRIVGNSNAISVVRDVATSIAPRRSTVMLLGETGTGKEMLARHIHAQSERANKPFIPVDCSSMTESLFESQLFGHIKGAFTGAVRESLGFIRAADGGTLFIDEVGELPLVLQAKLLRVLQERCVVPVGDVKPRPVDVRVITATHRDLSAMVRAGTFREDLYFRLNVVVLQVPPLRERPDDVVPLAQHFLAVQADLYDEPAKALSPEAAELLRQHPWPGNVRELANVIEHAHVLASAGVIRAADLPVRLRQLAESQVATPSDLRLIDVERRTIAEALNRANFCKAAASRMLGINIQRLNRRIRSLGIHLPSDHN
jgi:transcriptional regulator with PAS, ATPase and Fis domain